MKQIFKVQVPMSTNAEHPLALIYNKDRNVEFQCHVTDEIRNFMGGAFKKFAYGELIGDQVSMDFTQAAPWQVW